MNRRCGFSKPTPTHLNVLAMKSGKTRRKGIEGNADTILRQTTRQKPAAYHQCGGGGARRKRRYGKTNKHQNPPAMYVTYFVLPSTPFMRWLGGDTEYPLAGLPIKLVLGEYSPLLSLRRRSREAAWIFPPEPWWHLMIWGSRLSHFMIIPITKRHPNNTNTDQLPIPEVITGFPRPYHNTWALNVTRIHTFLAARTILVLVLLPNG